jgi:hypothetical protein
MKFLSILSLSAPSLQAFHHETWMAPGVSGGTYMYDRGQPIDASSPLFPFPAVNENSDGLFMTAQDAQDIRTLGYT